MPRRRRGRLARPGGDRVAVALFSVATFLVLLAVLASHVPASTARAGSRRIIIVRKLYTTTVVESTAGPGPDTSSVSQSQTTSGYTPGGGSSVPVTTRASSGR